MPGQIERLDRQSAIELAKRMRNRARNASMRSAELMTHGATIGGAVAGNLLLGRIMGAKEHEYAQNQAAIEAQEMDDPRKIAGFDIELVVGTVATGAGLAMQGLLGGKSKSAGALGAAVEGVGLGALSAYAFTMGADAGRKAAEEEA